MGRLIRGILTLAVLAVIVIGGFWGYRTTTMAQPYDEYWVRINKELPAPLRQWSCETVSERNKPKQGKAPSGCEGFWK